MRLKLILLAPVYIVLSLIKTTSDNIFGKELPEVFFPSLVQELLDKEYEIRTFFLLGNFYSVCIFSQQDDKTKIDFRNYHHEKPNRISKYVLPNEIQNKLRELMNKFKLNSGSLDLVFTKDNKYVLLEVNPVGQFAVVSENGNYDLELMIAETLNQLSYE